MPGRESASSRALVDLNHALDVLARIIDAADV